MGADTAAIKKIRKNLKTKLNMITTVVKPSLQKETGGKMFVGTYRIFCPSNEHENHSR